VSHSHSIGGKPRGQVYQKTLIFFPTFNERDCVGPLVGELLQLADTFDLLIIDDSSNDGTTEILHALAGRNPRIRLVVREGKRGVGSAHKDAWAYARQEGYSQIVTMDGDLSHAPNDVMRVLSSLDESYDVAIGSRFLPGAKLDYRGWRRFLSCTGNSFAGRLLHLSLTEYTNSLRAARLDRVPASLVEDIPDDGYTFFLTCTVRFVDAGLHIKEVPIHFRERHAGSSKIPTIEAMRAAINVFRIAWARHNRPRA
jgi:dolichol-phosphate mannosyltransferase